MSIPSIKTIETRLQGILKELYLNQNKPISIYGQARAIRINMENAEHGSFDQIDMALENINVILHGYGVEAIRDNSWDSYYCDIGVLYVNMGETYTPTVIYDTRSGRFSIQSWGDVVERNEKRFNV